MKQLGHFALSLRTAAFAALAALAVAGNAQIDARTQIRIVVDGNLIEFPYQQPYRQDGRVLVPLRGVFQRLGANVDWDPTTETVTAHKPGVTVKLAIGDPNATVNGRDVRLDVPASLMGGSTMIPLRFVSEALGADVTWVPQMYEVDISAASQDMIAADRPREIDTVVSRLPIRHVLPANTVIPWRLNSRITSDSANQGDPFTATLDTQAPGGYMGLPAGTVLDGTVGYVRNRQVDRPGVIELRFDRMVLPNGRSIPITGRLVSLDDKAVYRTSDGVIHARTLAHNSRPVFAGVGAGAGLIVGLLSSRPIEDAAIGGLLGFALGSVASRQPTEVVLHEGMSFGVLLTDQARIPD